MSTKVMGVIALGLALALVYVQHEWDTAKTEVQVLRAAAEKNRAAAEAVARQHAERISALGQQHAKNQQEITDGYIRKIASLDAGRASDSTVIARLRSAINTYAVSGGTPGEADATACERAGNRRDTLAGLLAEGAELVVEGSRIVERRDAEVSALTAILRNDRALITLSDPPK